MKSNLNLYPPKINNKILGLPLGVATGWNWVHMITTLLLEDVSDDPMMSVCRGSKTGGSIRHGACRFPFRGHRRTKRRRDSTGTVGQ